MDIIISNYNKRKKLIKILENIDNNYNFVNNILSQECDIVTTDMINNDFKLTSSNDNPEFILLVGHPGAGKSTILKQQTFLKYDINSYTYIDPDDLRMFSPGYRKNINGTQAYTQDKTLQKSLYVYKLPTGTFNNYNTYVEYGYTKDNKFMSIKNLIGKTFSCKNMVQALTHSFGILHDSSILYKCMVNKSNVIFSLSCDTSSICTTIINTFRENNYTVKIICIYTDEHIGYERIKKRMYKDGRYVTKQYYNTVWTDLWDGIKQKTDIYSKLIDEYKNDQNINVIFINNNNQSHK
jgi:predicted ABC-type ATPase